VLLVRITCVLFFLAASQAAAAGPNLVIQPGAFPTLINPNCSHCVDEAKRRAGELRDDDPVLCWTRGYSEGGAIPIRFFLSPYRVISDSYGLFVYDPDAGYARGFAPSYNFRFHGWRNGVMAMKDIKDGTLYSCLSGEAFDGPRKGHRLAPIGTLTSTWGDVMKHYPHAVAYHMFEKYKPVALPTENNPESVKSRLAPDPRLKPDDMVLGVHVGEETRAYPRAAFNSDGTFQDTLGGETVVVFRRSAPTTLAAYKLIAHQPRKWKGPSPDADGVSPPDAGTPLSGKEEPPIRLTFHTAKDGSVVDDQTKGTWDIAGRCIEGDHKGWTLEPVDAVECKWFAWAAEHPRTAVFEPAAKPKAGPKEKIKMVAGKAEFLRVLPKAFGTVKAVDPRARTVTLLLDSETVAKVWPVAPDAEVRVNGWWGRLEQFKPSSRVWVWLKLNREKQPVAVAMLADLASEWDMHGNLREGAAKQKPPAWATDLEARRAEQQAWLREQWTKEGLPGTLTFAHVFSGELELMLDHEAMRWGRSLKSGDVVHIQADPPIQAVVKTVTPWRERTHVQLVVGELASADLQVGQRLPLKMTPPPSEVDRSPYPPDIDRPRTKAERIEWFLSSTYCVCGIRPDICTGQFYTLASCNPNGCGAPNALRQEVGDLIDKGQTDRQIWDKLLRDRGRWMTLPHLMP
jgi:hypothetical protein